MPSGPGRAKNRHEKLDNILFRVFRPSNFEVKIIAQRDFTDFLRKAFEAEGNVFRFLPQIDEALIAYEVSDEEKQEIHDMVASVVNPRFLGGVRSWVKRRLPWAEQPNQDRSDTPRSRMS